ncbi:quinone-dependent dihydroorotate dehydrogenase [Martelella mediterranea]|uniref:Dihydroorotate dehydrogenase (quinone) n=1 Tax=Martelella mediterranea DSM 17316 TaxID=1122214 RepID=A0A1U9Z749_9HYPH|nr:quinone-dependent dihydroorotate dehydrogenase [Martelella mediterranea]AQZ53549.1 Dihydroorotate dehydrogenase (quinone) [Martelella mediterranea DSM 17316]
MIDLYRCGGRRAAFALDPELAHGLTLKAIRTGLLPGARHAGDTSLQATVAGLSFKNPLGVAAGLDKNGEALDGLLKLGFGHAEAGTVTPRPQPGNPKPRLFRLVKDEAVINRMGFNNDGHDALAARLERRNGSTGPGVIGVNIGANKTSEDRIADYVAGITRFSGLADYLTVNISSPNTPGLRDLQARAELARLLGRVAEAREKAARKVPVFLKIAPDLTEEGLDDIVAEVLNSTLDGVIVSNTTLSRAGLREEKLAGEAGGLSGAPLFERSTALLARMRQRLGPDLALIGVGGVNSGARAVEKIRAGADLVQIYSGMTYEGPQLIDDSLTAIIAAMREAGVSAPRALRDSGVAEWAAKPFTG